MKAKPNREGGPEQSCAPSCRPADPSRRRAIRKAVWQTPVLVTLGVVSQQGSAQSAQTVVCDPVTDPFGCPPDPPL